MHDHDGVHVSTLRIRLVVELSNSESAAICILDAAVQAWGVMEYREGNLDRARELLQQGVWADPNSADVAKVFHAWGVLEKSAGNVDLAREMFRCAVKADPNSEPGWLVSVQGPFYTATASRACQLIDSVQGSGGSCLRNSCQVLGNLPLQSWALLEEDVGAVQRAEELRSFRQQRRTEIVLPRTFADPDVVLAPVFSQIAAWFKHSEVRACGAISLRICFLLLMRPRC